MNTFTYDPVLGQIIAPWCREHPPTGMELRALRAAMAQVAKLTPDSVVALLPDQDPEPMVNPTRAWLREQATIRAVYVCAASRPRPARFKRPVSAKVALPKEEGPMWQAPYRSPATLDFYRTLFDTRFVPWCEAHKVSSLPTTSRTVAGFVVSMANQRCHLSTVRLILAAIELAHANDPPWRPGGWLEVYQALGSVPWEKIAPERAAYHHPDALFGNITPGRIRKA
jgi:hypothetical protein